MNQQVINDPKEYLLKVKWTLPDGTIERDSFGPLIKAGCEAVLAFPLQAF